MTNEGLTIEFTGRTALVTGGTRGIGKAIADILLQGGAHVISTGTDKEAVEQLNAESGKNDRLKYIVADFISRESTDEFLDSIDQLVTVDILVNNAGMNRISTIDEISVEEYDYLSNVNLRAPYLLCRQIIPGMKARSYGRIVNIASIWSVKTKAGRSAYSVTKQGLIGLTKALAVELGVHNILVNAVSPGFTETELTRSTLSESEMEQLATQIPMGRFAQSEEIARAVAFLASDTNSYITGQNLVVDGGFIIV